MGPPARYIGSPTEIRTGQVELLQLRSCESSWLTSVFAGIVNFVRRTTRIVKRTLRVQKTVREGPGARFPPGEEAGRGTETRRDN